MLKKENWKLFNDIKHSPYENMAIDESILEECFKIKTPILRFYGWDRKSASVGYIQKFSAVPENLGYTVVRRPTGGGVVYHDIDMTYTVTVPKGHWIENLNRIESYHIIHKTIIKSFYSLGIESSLVNYDTKNENRMTTQCFVSPTKYDVVLNNEVSSKAAGAAQRRTKHGILHQGSIVLKSIDIIKPNLKDKIIQSFSEDLCIKFEEFTLNEILKTKIKELVEKKYSSDKWNRMR
ncbi:MAG: lipoate--protein ligase family protein [Victivallales bacterium]|nr:lipoate--protein ligase family protein [Victivallales bacterium]MCF7889004.1 lipoate--protein ligase family protein [Victivallales bacterium]